MTQAADMPQDGHGAVTLGWGDGTHRFRLGLGEVMAVQTACDAGPAYVLERLKSGMWRVEDVRAVLLHGLTGGGMPPAQARKLIERFVDQAPLMESVSVAQAVMMAALYGPGDDPAELPPGKPEAA